jgi:hypothetical protein
MLHAFQLGARSLGLGVFASRRCSDLEWCPASLGSTGCLFRCCWTAAGSGSRKVPHRFLSSDFTLRAPCAEPDRRSIRARGGVGVHGVAAAKNRGEHFSAVTLLEPVPCAGAVSLRALLRVTRLPSETATRTARAGCAHAVASTPWLHHSSSRCGRAVGERSHLPARSPAKV